MTCRVIYFNSPENIIVVQKLVFLHWLFLVDGQSHVSGLVFWLAEEVLQLPQVLDCLIQKDSVVVDVLTLGDTVCNVVT